MADIIQLLPDHVANQIAAGEVVQRPASVVKELIENAVDAGATEIKLIAKDSGKTLIQVVDNGGGMSPTDARLSFERHATSKIRAAEDLFRLGTKGFRGEALASIAAIAHVEMNTRQQGEEVGTRIRMEGGKIVDQEVTVTPEGTSIAVKNLFFNIPARRNFLKSNQVELRHVIDEFQRVALAHPDIQFEMYHNGNDLFSLPASNYRQRVVNIFGSKTNEKLVPVEENTEVLKLSGFVYKPQHARKSRGEQFFFVNNRFIKSPYLHHAVLSAFEGLIKEQTHPGYFLYLDVDPTTVDINIHPTKTEIKFDDEHTLYAILRSAIKHSLGQFNIAPVLDFDKDAGLETPYDYKDKPIHVPTIEVDSDFNPFRDEEETKISGSEKKETAYRGGKTSWQGSSRQEKRADWESLYVGLGDKPDSPDNFSSVEIESDEVAGTEGKPTERLFDDRESGEPSFNTYQLHKKYIVTTIKSGMVIIDQHRAHQRVLYEQFLRQMTVKESISQQLLFPIVLHYSPSDTALLKELRETLEFIGFAIAKLQGEEIEITGIPASISESEVSMILEQLIADFKDEIPDSSFSQSDRLAKSLSKTLAVRTGEPLNVASQEVLVNNLFACKEPTRSPFNRPTYITITVEDLEKKFL
ncbi:DNA mismatch repair endonuclease MutL [Sinomicrobium weinanense]|uniref:DNA mismatch repair protein MutL n=1 Tax=Sinomicrobium weinanense TaxID=2842200 RepID=A0A926JRA6_9FLAO|nr:DNA mismatch repair endonuclease MutL [Sinomicrobium weinanense]MBC9796055.1 DNA mismatch repair endonuclease MutL [Sinomicrobium weinanense]MBU3123126.1 DNA mismatch repair endonuclease MutL [Sinomicrobium weinanense]